MAWKISFSCGALYLHFIRCCSWLYALNLVDFVNDMAWKISFPCGALFCTYSYFIWCCSCLDALNPVDFINFITWHISFPCGALYLVSTLFALPGRLINSLGATENILIICPFVKATVLFFISCRDKTFFCNKDSHRYVRTVQALKVKTNHI